MSGPPNWESELFEFRSFEFEERGLRLEVDSCAAMSDGGKQPVTIDRVTNTIDLHAQVEEFDECECVLLTGRVSRTITQPGRIWLQILCLRTRLETNVLLEEHEGVYPYEVLIKTRDVRGAVSVRPLLVEDSPGSSGLVIASGDPVQIAFDEPEPAFGGGLQTQWSTTAFTERRIPNALTHLDTSSNDDAPILFLNDGVRDFRLLLTSRGSRGPVARLRQMLLDWIEADVWFALGRRAAERTFRLGDEGTIEVAEEDSLTEWPGAVLDRLAGMLNHPSGNEGRRKAAGDLLDHSNHELIRGAIASSVGGAGLRGRLEALIADLPRHAEEGEGA